ncbi:MAG: hypothetical protein JW953_17110 [Anaerolineae bacterium]|nr:hypothetical protein [Anaerolineae bacterium]
MEILFMGIFFLVITLAAQRREAFQFRWQPTRHSWVTVSAGLLAFGLSALLLLFERESWAARIIHYGLIYIGCGVVIPWGYTLLAERRSLAALGLTRARWRTSLILNVALAALFSPLIIFQADFNAVNWQQVGQAAFALSWAGGLFELFLYYGFIHLRLRRAFGVIPAILGTSVLYVLWHVGTQLPYEADPTLALVKLLAVGIMYQSVFSFTYNLLIIWPFFHAVGVMIDFAVNIGELEAISPRFPLAVAAVILMGLVGAGLLWLAQKRVGFEYKVL